MQDLYGADPRRETCATVDHADCTTVISGDISWIIQMRNISVVKDLDHFVGIGDVSYV